MKSLSKLFLGLGGLAAVCGGVSSVCYGTTNSTVKNVVATSDTYLTGGTSFYLRTKTDVWAKDSPKFAMYFFANGVPAQWSSYMTVMDFTQASDHTFVQYSCTVPGDSSVHFTTAIALRVNSAQTTPAFDSNEWNRISDFSVSDTKNRVDIVYSDNFSFGTTSSCEAANIFAGYFAYQFKNVCQADGESNSDNVVTAWTSSQTKYDQLVAEGSDMSAFNTATADAETNTDTKLKNDIGQAAALYDHLRVAYPAPLSNFASRTSSGSGAALVTKDSDKTATVVLGGLAVVSVAAAGGYFFIRKKHVA